MMASVERSGILDDFSYTCEKVLPDIYWANPNIKYETVSILGLPLCTRPLFFPSKLRPGAADA